jgi:hypothetical protein
MSEKDNEVTKSVHPDIKEEISLEEHQSSLKEKVKELVEDYNKSLADFQKILGEKMQLINRVQGAEEFVRGYNNNGVEKDKE